MTIQTLLEQIHANRADQREAAARAYNALVFAAASGKPTPSALEVSELLSQLGLSPERLAHDAAKAEKLLAGLRDAKQLAAHVEADMALERQRAAHDARRVVIAKRLEAEAAELALRHREAYEAAQEAYSAAEEACKAGRSGSGARTEVALRLAAARAELAEAATALAGAEAFADLGPAELEVLGAEGGQAHPEVTKALRSRVTKARKALVEVLAEAATLAHLDWAAGEFEHRPRVEREPSRERVNPVFKEER
ncbi:MAG: hypothetical protein AB7N76_09575 [Planctomycetota bacterium]